MSESCGCRGPYRVIDRNGKMWCRLCYTEELVRMIESDTRLEGHLNGLMVKALNGDRIGTVVERVTNTGARTPTGGKYSSDRMTVRDLFGGTWYANAPKEGTTRLILRRAK